MLKIIFSLLLFAMLIGCILWATGSVKTASKNIDVMLSKRFGGDQ